jgi:hypothetical protein
LKGIMERCLTASNSVFAALLLAYPADFRRQYGTEMASVFAESSIDTYERCGTSGLAGLWSVTAYDLLWSACAEHVSRLLSTLRNDFRALTYAPAFAAATGALAANLFAALGIVMGPVVGLNKNPQERFFCLAAACLNVAVLWLFSVLTSGRGAAMPMWTVLNTLSFKQRMAAFRHLATVAMVLLLCPTARFLIRSNAFSLSGRSFYDPIPLHYWVLFSALPVTTIMAVFLLQPFLTLRTVQAAKDKRTRISVISPETTNVVRD